jgi:hypothetical protein
MSVTSVTQYESVISDEEILEENYDINGSKRQFRLMRKEKEVDQQRLKLLCK